MDGVDGSESSEGPTDKGGVNCIGKFRNGKKISELLAADMMEEVFESLEDADAFYTIYSRIMGLGLRKQGLIKEADGNIRRRSWVCDKEGYRRDKWLHLENRSVPPRPLTRVGCAATFAVRRTADTESWVVCKFVPDHSHELLSSHEVHCLRSNRSVNDDQMDQARSMHNASISTSKIMQYMVHQAGGYKNVGFTIKDLHNKFTADRIKGMPEGDSEALLAHFTTKATADPKMFFKYTEDDEHRLANVFWADSKSRFDYSVFGDVIAFDATYKTNVYKKPFVIFIGVNNHQRTTIFGMALLVDETVATYTWVLQTFLEAMDKKAPVAIITDGDKAMRKGIEDVVPDAFHRLCIWHIGRNAQAKLQDKALLAAFNDCMLTEYTPNEFDLHWESLVHDHGGIGKDWLSMMYDTRDMWAAAFMRGRFFAGMRTTQRCESTNSFMNKYVKRKQKLYQFIQSVDQAIARMRNQEVDDDFQCKVSTPVLTTHLKVIEKHASDVFTRSIYEKMRDQITASAVMITVSRVALADMHVYTVTKFGHPELTWTASDETLPSQVITSRKITISRSAKDICNQTLHTFKNVAFHHFGQIQPLVGELGFECLHNPERTETGRLDRTKGMPKPHKPARNETGCLTSFWPRITLHGHKPARTETGCLTSFWPRVTLLGRFWAFCLPMLGLFCVFLVKTI